MKSDDAPASMRDAAYRALRRLLVLQKIPEGQRLREPQWAAQLRVNRVALREAFARLEAEGLIEKGERTGYVVPVLRRIDLDEILFVRTVLECAAIDLVCVSASLARQASRTMLACCKEFEQFARSKYSLGMSEADRRFHESLMDAAQNRRLAMLYHRAPLPLIHSRIATESEWAEQAGLTSSEHRAVVAAIADRDALQAKKRLKAHLSARQLLPTFA